mgnify:CR=1 FL=1
MASTLLTCTSTTRPGSPSAGDTLFQTDDGRIITWDGSNWYVYDYDSRIDPAYNDWQLGYPSGLFTSTDYTISVQPIMHFDAAILDGADKANNPVHDASVTAWGDRSGQATDYDATQGTGSAQPQFKISGEDRYVYFDGGDVLDTANGYDRTAGNPWTIVMVGNAAGAANIYYAAPNESGGGSVQLGKYSNGSIYPGPVVSGQDLSTFNMLTYTRTAANVLEVYRDGDTSLGSRTQASTFVHEAIGPSGTTKTTGNIYECMLFDSILTNANLNIINAYLANKYDGSPSLPTLTAWT